MVKLINDSVIDTAKELLNKIQKSIDTTHIDHANLVSKLWLDEIKFHLHNKRPNGAYHKYDVSRLNWLINHLGPKYLLE